MTEMTTKYIVYTDGDDMEKMVIFCGLERHAYRAIDLGTVVSAGFIDGQYRCYGESGSLDVKSRDRDTDLLRWLLGWHDYPVMLH